MKKLFTLVVVVLMVVGAKAQTESRFEYDQYFEFRFEK